jgi:pimeloyl-ACP methyl ester carboxylesterase
VSERPLIWSEEAGDRADPLIVLIHGAMDRSAGLLKLSRRLDGGYRVRRYDRRGYGRSRPHPGPFTMEAHLADLDAGVAGRRVVLVGHSYGGNVALAFAGASPSLVRAVVVYETPLSWLPWWPGTTAGGSALADVDDAADAAERFMRRLVGDHRWERLPARTRAARCDEGQAMIDELTDLRLNPPWKPEQIGVPVLVVHGEHGASHHQDGSRALAAMLAGAESAEIAGAAHFGPNTHPDDVAAIIRDFVRRRASP